MTIQETIEFLENKKRHDSYSREEYDTAIEACRRQESMKVDTRTFGEDTFFCCPNCQDITQIIVHDNYCSQCGQKLDWSV